MYYFAYGSNLFRRRIEQRLGRCRFYGTGWLDGYTLRFHKMSKDGSGKCNVYKTQHKADRVYGALFDLSDKQKAALDGFEGPGYDSVAVLINSQSGIINAQTYVAKPNNIEPSLIPFDWYKAFVVEGAKEVHLPGEYIRQLEHVNSTEDVDHVRSHSNWSLLSNGDGD